MQTWRLVSILQAPRFALGFASIVLARMPDPRVAPAPTADAAAPSPDASAAAERARVRSFDIVPEKVMLKPNKRPPPTRAPHLPNLPARPAFAPAGTSPRASVVSPSPTTAAARDGEETKECVENEVFEFEEVEALLRAGSEKCGLRSSDEGEWRLVLILSRLVSARPTRASGLVLFSSSLSSRLLSRLPAQPTLGFGGGGAVQAGGPPT